jgi:uncharacterized membrane protein
MCPPRNRTQQRPVFKLLRNELILLGRFRTASIGSLGGTRGEGMKQDGESVHGLFIGRIGGVKCPFYAGQGPGVRCR